MKGQLIRHLSLLAAVTCTCHGASYTSDFSSAAIGDPLVAAPATVGINGWTQSQANIDNLSPRAWIAPVGPSSAKGLAIGAFFDTYSGSSFHVNQTLSWSLTGGALSMTIGILDSTLGFPDRNDFSVGLLDAVGGSLVTIDFTANSQNFVTPITQANRSWNVSVNGGLPFAAVYDNATYHLFMDFVASGPNAAYSLDITDSEPVPTTLSGTGTITGGASANIGNLRIGTTIGDGSDWGDNIFAATNIMIPEPSSTLLLGLGALGLLRRRRD